MVTPYNALRMTIESWNGHDLNDASYTSKFIGLESGANPPAQTVLSTRPGHPPMYVRSQPMDQQFKIRVVMSAETDALHEQLAGWFDSRLGQCYLVVSDSGGVQRRVLCSVENFEPAPNVRGNAYDITLRRTRHWEAVTATTPAATHITASGQTIALTNLGDGYAYPSFTLTPNTMKSPANDYTRWRRISMFNRSEYPVTDPVGDGWPLNLAPASFDTVVAAPAAISKTSGVDNVVNATTKATASITPVVDRVIFAAFSRTRQGGGTPSAGMTVAGNGLTWSRVFPPAASPSAGLFAGNALRLDIFMARVTVATAGVITATFPEAAAVVAWSVFEISNLDLIDGLNTAVISANVVSNNYASGTSYIANFGPFKKATNASLMVVAVNPGAGPQDIDPAGSPTVYTAINRANLTLNDTDWILSAFHTGEDNDAVATTTASSAALIVGMELGAKANFLSSLNDLRVLHNGREINRWPSPATADAATKIWSNIQMDAKRTAIAAGERYINADGFNQLDVRGPAYLEGWPPTGFFSVNNMVCRYNSRSDTGMIVSAVGLNSSPVSAIAAGDTLYWVEHPYLCLIYNKTSATDPLPPDDRKPVIDLAASTNTSFKWGSLFFNSKDRRSAAFQPFKSDDGPQTAYMTAAGASGLVFQDIIPTSTRPNFNNAYIDIPMGIKASTNLVLDWQVQANLRLNVYSLDAGGNEILVVSYRPTGTSTTLAATFTLSEVGFRLRFNGRHGALTGEINITGGADVPLDAIAPAVGPPQVFPNTAHSFVVDEDEAGIIGIAAYLKAVSGTPQVNMMILEDYNGVPGTVPILATATVTFSHAGYAWEMGIFPGADDRPLRLKGGQRYHAVFYELGGGEAAIYANAFRSKANQYSVVGGDINAPTFAVRLLGYRDFPSIAQEDAPVNSTEFAQVNNLIIPLDDTRTPTINVAAEEQLYYLQATILNQTTGDSMQITWPMALAQSITIDCENQRVTNNADGQDITFAVVPSNFFDWLFLVPGLNTIQILETGVVDLSVAPSFRSTWLS